MNLAAAVELMWSADCGALPVVDEEGRVAGILTDRDIAIALGTRNRPAAEVLVREVAAGGVRTCAPDDDLHAAMSVMRRAKVRRLPVTDDQGRIKGILALNDIVLAVDRKHGDVTYEEAMNTLKAVCEHPSHATSKPPASKVRPQVPAAVA
jgi:CBS-domain-containing membrane protein